MGARKLKGDGDTSWLIRKGYFWAYLCLPPTSVTQPEASNCLKHYRGASVDFATSLLTGERTFQEWVTDSLGWTIEIVQHAYAGIRGFWLPEGQELTPEQLAMLKGNRTFKVLPRR